MSRNSGTSRSIGARAIGARAIGAQSARAAQAPLDEMGAEMAGGPAAVRGTLDAVQALRPVLDPLFATARRIVLLGTGASLAAIRAAAPAWRARIDSIGAGGGTGRGAHSGLGPGQELVIRQSSDAVLGNLDGLDVRRSDLVVAVSQSGTSPETLVASREAVAAGASVVALTAHSDSPLAAAATLLVEMASGEEADASTKSALAALAGLLAMGGVIASEAAAAARSESVLAGVVASAADVEPAGRVLADANRTWCLGFGTGLGIAEAAALLWHEKVVRQAVAATPAEFRHGLIEAAGPGDAVVLVEVDAPDPRRAGYLARLRGELAELGLAVIELGTPGGGRTADGAGTAARIELGTPGGARSADGAGTAARIDLPTTSQEPGLRALETLLRIQQLARAAALAGGTYRDGFRILRRVVKPAVELTDPHRDDPHRPVTDGRRPR